MFETYPDYHIDVPEELKDPGEFDWSMFCTRLSVPWMFVVAQQSGLDIDGDEVHITSNYFLGNCRELIRLQQTALKIRQIYLAIPPVMNKTGGWDFQLVSEIWSLDDLKELLPTDPVQAVFATQSGSVFNTTFGEEGIAQGEVKIYSSVGN